jgi:hypothetical protein
MKALYNSGGEMAQDIVAFDSRGASVSAAKSEEKIGEEGRY